MGLKKFKATGFRCLDETVIAPDPRLNLITGSNASGKTSILESIFYLGRGRSFRSSGNRELIRTGSGGFLLYGEMEHEGRPQKAGIEVAIGQRSVRINGEQGTGADLAKLLPVQVIDPEVHELVQGGPELRRRFMDWGVFHVKHSFLDTWRNYQKALRQRNAALRQGETDRNVRIWDEPLAEHGEQVDQDRQEFLEQFLPLFSSISSEYLLFDSNCRYKRGWSSNVGLKEALHDSLARDRAFGATQVGPHRADLPLEVHARRARYRVSRGQQKMLAATLVIAQSRFVAAHIPTELVFLVDDPAAELDRDNRERLFAMLHEMPAQMFVTALEPEDLPWSTQGTMFHLEHGRLASLL